MITIIYESYVTSSGCSTACATSQDATRRQREVIPLSSEASAWAGTRRWPRRTPDGKNTAYDENIRIPLRPQRRTAGFGVWRKVLVTITSRTTLVPASTRMPAIAFPRNVLPLEDSHPHE